MKKVYVRTVCVNCENFKETVEKEELCIGIIPLVNPVTGEVLTEKESTEFWASAPRIRMEEFFHNDNDGECRWFVGEKLPKILKMYDESLGRNK